MAMITCHYGLAFGPCKIKKQKELWQFLLRGAEFKWQSQRGLCGFFPHPQPYCPSFKANKMPSLLHRWTHTRLLEGSSKTVWSKRHLLCSSFYMKHPEEAKPYRQKGDGWVSGAGGRENGEWLLKRQGVSFRGGANLESDSGDGRTMLWMYYKPQKRTL